MAALADGLAALLLAITAIHRTIVEIVGWRWWWRGLAESAATLPRPPVTWLRPLKPGVRNLPEKLATFLASLEPEDQVIFGVESDSTEAQLCRELAEAHPGKIEVVTGSTAGSANPKITRLECMTPFAQHEFWILVDAEAQLDAAFARNFRQEWAASGADVLTAGYRFGGARTWIERLDAVAAIQTLWPGLLISQAAGPLRFTLGACTGFKRRDIEDSGGWSSLADRLAEDYELGARLAARGRVIRLSRTILELESDPLSWREYWRHQMRVAVTYRAATPAGAAGMILTRGFSLCALIALISPDMWTLAATLFAAGLHLSGVAAQATRLGIAPGPWLAASLPADVIETACWTLSWATRRVWWAGKWRPISWRGKLRPPGPLKSL